MNKKIVHSVFEHIAAKFPDNNAVEESSGAAITYRDLNRNANIAASLLLERGIGRDRLAGILLPTGIAYTTAIMATIKAGGIFMPLDLELPRPRLNHILSHTTPTVIITDETSTAELQEILEEFGLADTTHLLVLDNTSFFDIVHKDGRWQRSTATVNSDGSNLEMVSKPEDSCYVIYTSGSTGIPKFIEGWHKGLAHYCHWQSTEFSLNETSRISQMAPVTFEASLKDFFVALCCGATLCTPTAAIKENPARLIEWIENSGLTLFQTVPSFLRLIIREAAAQGRTDGYFPKLKLVFQSGDTLYGKDVNQWRETVGNHVELVNLYGPAEVTLLKTFNRIPLEELKANEIVAIGKPISNSAILILNGNNLCQPGKIGEICVKSPFIVKGYYRSPELTAEKFVQNPLNPETTDIIYRTGDLGRYKSDMIIDFVGRMDSQVKVHGNRIELAEIENVLLAFHKIGQVVVVPHRTDEMENILVCYYTEQESVNQSELRALILSKLPDYMVPAYFISMEELPLSLNGKVDRKALPKPEELVITNYEAPTTETEKGLIPIWCEILGLCRIGVKNPFIEIGGDSLKAIRVIARIYKQFGVEVSVRDFFAHPTVSELASFIDAANQKSYQPIPTVPDADCYELSHAQRRLWTIDKLESSSSAYNMAASMLIVGEFDADAFVRAVQTVHKRHETLRTTFVAIDGIPKQLINSKMEPDVTKVDLSSDDNPEQAARDSFQAEASKHFDLATGPLYRIRLLKLDEERTVLSFIIHHIISDVWSLGVMASELSKCYNNFAKNIDEDLPLLSIQYRDFAAWQNDILASETIEPSRQYWLEKLAGPLPLLDLPADFPRPPVKSYAGGTVNSMFNRELTQKLNDLSAESDASLFATLIALVRVLVYRYTGQEDLVIGSPIAGRVHPDLESQIGFFINTLALRDQVDAEKSFVELLAKVMKTNTAAFDHQGFPFDSLVDELKIPRDVSRSPVFDLMVVLQNTEQASFSLNNATVTEFERFESVSKFDLDFVFTEQGGQLEMLIEYNADIFSRTTVERFSEHLIRLSEAVVNDPTSAVCTLPLLTNSEFHQIMDLFNRKSETSPFIPNGKYLHQLFEQQTKKTAHAVALIHKSREISYDELNESANQLAHYLKQFDVKNDTLVAICMERSIDMIIALLAILKSGAAYVPMDSSYPNDRLSFMLEDSGAKILITKSILLQQLPQTRPHTICLDTDKEAIAVMPKCNPSCYIAPDNLAYLIYTSGSTGKPKGVAIEHRSPAAFIEWCHSIWSIDELTGVLAGTSVCFDLSIFEMFVPLSVGGTVIIAEHVLELPNIEAKERVTLINTVPSAIDALVRQNALPESVRVVNLAGEPLTTELADRVYAVPSVQKVYDLYGPSEDTTYSTCKLRIPGEPPSIGRPIAHTQLYILDRHNQPTPIGVPGELHIGGAGLARCYLNRPELTAEKFIPDPFSNEPDARLYKTGDLARYRLDGNVEYLGRLDHQVKIRGFRIELGEIEAALAAHYAIQEAAVIARDEDSGGKRLVAYIVLKADSSNTPPTTGELLSFLKTTLPDYMLPAASLFLPALPLTPNGKLDRKALPDPRSDSADTLNLGTDYVAPRTEMEQIVASIWSGVLGIEKVGVHDNYFALGGDSIRAIQVGSRLQQQGLKMDMLDIFQFPTVAGLSGRVVKLTRVPDQSAVTGQIMLTPVQHWFFEYHKQSLHHFNQTNLLKSKERLNPEILRTLLKTVVNHHDALRINFVKHENSWIQENQPVGTEPVFEFLDLSNNKEPLLALEHHAENIQRGFKLENAPLMSVVLYRLPDGDRLLIAVHHLIIDGVSWRILAEDLITGYTQITAGKSVSLPQKSDSYKSWSSELEHYSNSDALLQELEYWQSIAKTETTQELSQDRVTIDSDFDEIVTALTVEETNMLLNSANLAYSTDTQDLLLTALATTLETLTGSRKQLITMEGHGRENIGSDIDISRTVGWFTSIFPHVLELAERDDPGYQLRTIKEAVRNIPNHGVGYGVLRWLTQTDLKKGYELPMLPRISFNYLGTFDADFNDGLLMPANEKHGNTVGAEFDTTFDMDFNSSIMNGHLSINFRYNRNVIKTDTAQRISEVMLQSLRNLIIHCCQQKESVMTPSDISYDGLDIDQLDSLLNSLGD